MANMNFARTVVVVTLPSASFLPKGVLCFRLPWFLPILMKLFQRCRGIFADLTLCNTVMLESDHASLASAPGMESPRGSKAAPSILGLTYLVTAKNQLGSTTTELQFRVKSTKTKARKFQRPLRHAADPESSW